jgi:glycosyltransferase involved in cell wall biosynthesis
MNHRPDISVVIPVRNEGHRIHDAVESIVNGRSCQFGLEVVLVDDASDDECCLKLSTFDRLRSNRVDLRVVRLPQWSGIPYARNVGAAAARGETLFITDANVIFPRNWDVPIRREIRTDNALCASIADAKSSFVGYGCILHVPSMGVGWLRNPYTFQGHIPVAPCSATIINAGLFRKLGGYDLGLPLYGAAEPEFSVRLWLSGCEIKAVPELRLLHYFKTRPRHLAFLERIEEVLVRNCIRFGLLYLDHPRAIRMLKFYAARRSQNHFRKVLHDVVQRGVWQHRERLKSILKYDFEAYLRRFPGICAPA